MKGDNVALGSSCFDTDTGNGMVLFSNIDVSFESNVGDEVVVIAILQALLNSLTADSLESNSVYLTAILQFLTYKLTWG